MDSKGNIYGPEAIQALLEAEMGGDERATKKLQTLIPLEEVEAQKLAGMNRAQRRAFYSNNRRKRPRFGGASK